MTYRYPAIVLLLFIIVTGCSDGKDREKHRIRHTVRIDRSSPAALLATLGDIIREGRVDLLFNVYTKESVRAVRHNNKVGIGTAGTTDGLLREEIALHIARTSPPDRRSSRPKRTGRRPRHVRNPVTKPGRRSVLAYKFTPPAIRDSRGGLLTVRWPSGNISPILLVKSGAKWYVDVLNGPGGKILLLKD